MTERRIQLLSDQVSNQIAAGEVVQRPSSVVKELVENAVDAGGTLIKVNIKDAGKTLVQVIDNGSGMGSADAELCFERHATSKIRSAEDLFHIRTKGFRGEALASIASVAQVELLTCDNENLNGVKIEIEGGKQVLLESCQTAKGSIFSVKNLFFNIPARRYFLKSDTVELRHIMEEFERVALTHPEVHFILNHNGQTVHDLPKSNFRQRIIHLFGAKYNDSLVPIEENTEIVQITGFVGKADIAKKTRGDQFFFVNQRFIKNGLLHHAISQAYDQIIPVGQFPFYILNLEVPTETLDVNVNPTKTEVKFQDERSIHAILHAAVRRGLGKYQIGPSLDFEQENIPLTQVSPEKVRPPQLRVNPDFNPFQPDSGWQNKSRNWMEQFQEAGFGFEQENKDKGQVEFFDDGDNEEFQKVFQASKAFIVAEREHGFYWYHQHLMHWSILYNDYLNSRDNSSTQTLLFPIEISDSPKRTAIILESKNLLERLGYILNQVEGKLYCTGVPNEMQEGEVLSFVNEFIEIVGHGLVADELEKEALKLATKKMAVRRGVMLTVPEMVDLLIRFVQQGEENRSPDGRKIFFVTDFEWMLKQLE